MHATHRAHRRLKHERSGHPHALRHLRAFFDHGRGGGSVRRGNVRYAILAVLRDRPMHGYEVITELESRTGGRWRPSAGSVYPTLQLLEDEGLLSSSEIDGRRTYDLTDAGRQAAEDVPQRWLSGDAASGEADQPGDLRKLAMGVIGAAVTIKRTGSPDANRAAREILIDSRKRLYRLLADDDGAETEAEA